jgi:hypothetical protein
VLLSGGVRAEHSKPYSKRGALLYCVAYSELEMHMDVCGVNQYLG